MQVQAQAQNALPPKTDAELDEQARQAKALQDKSQALASLPLYEDLHTRRPANSIYMEGLAMAYLARGGTWNSEAEKLADLKRARQLFVDAKAHGDESNLCQIMLEKLSFLDTAAPADSKDTVALPPGRASFNQAEVLFNKGDLKSAFELYKKSFEENPDFYPAPLYAGDSAFKLGNYDEASEWYARAVKIDPDQEASHRYWGDNLVKAGKPELARAQYIEAIIAQPYQKAPRLQLRSFAELNHMRIIPPPITLPAAPTVGDNGHINITLNLPTKGAKEDPLSSAWLMYSMNAALWHGDKFKQTFPNEKQYRHSLAEQVDSLKLLLAGVKEQKIKESDYTPTIRTLLALEKDNMLECWVLLDNPDQGVAQDYVAYRKAHRDLLHAYIETYELHPA
jgi:tetratricopeptide (TPR) repeat protein